VWYSEIVSNFNVLIMLILLSKLHPSMFRPYGKCLILKFNSGRVRFIYGFTIQPPEQMIDFITKLEQIRIANMRMPRLTPPLDIKDKVIETRQVEAEETLDIIEAEPALRYLPCDCMGTGTSGPAMFDNTLGLSIERLPGGESLSQSWKMASATPLLGVDEI
jgi:hypothetical protein